MELENLLLQNRYRLNACIGHGGMSEVWAAKDMVLHRIVAIKIATLDSRNSWDSFQHEAEISASLDHPHIVSIFDIGRITEAESLNTGLKGAPYIIMENVPGLSLKEKIISGMDYRVLTKYWIQILDAIEYAHSHQVIHRDIKPSNILIDASDNIKIVDFGVAKAEQKDWAHGKIVGTAAYMAPEIIRGEPASKQSDIYSLGVLFYQCLVGKLPFGKELNSNRAKIIPPSDRNPYIKDDPLIKNYGLLDGFILKALGPKQTRYASASEMKAAFLAINGKTKKKALPWPFILIVLIALIGIGFLIWHNNKDSKTQTVPSLVGLNIEKASELASEQGFLVETSYKVSNAPEGQVIFQDPPAGDNTDNLETIYLLVSAGRGSKVIPKTAGLLQIEAEQILERIGWQVEIVKEYNNRVAAGKVIYSSPKAGEKFPLDETVKLIVSSGKVPREVPDLIGMKESLAKSILEKGSFNWKAKYIYSNQPKGLVLSQNPEPGKSMNPLKTIVITISNGAEPEITPMLIGENIETARVILSDLKISYSTAEQETYDIGSDGIVISQSPLAGEALESGETVQLIVGRYVEQPPEIKSNNQTGGTEPFSP